MDALCRKGKRIVGVPPDGSATAINLMFVTAATWLPIILAPLALVFWLLLIWCLWPGNALLVLVKLPGGSAIQRHRLAAAARRRRPETLRALRSNDVEENRRSTPPANEHIKWFGMWTVELYTPAHVGRTLDAIHRLGWDRDEGGSHDVGSWLSDIRSRGALGYTNVGSFASKGSRPHPLVRQLDIPDCFARLSPCFVQLPFGVTALVATWIISEPNHALIEDALREPATADVQDLGGGSERYISVEQAKATRLLARRSEVRDAARSWLRANVPGVFAAGLTHEEMPSWDLVTTEASPLWGDDDSGRPGAHYGWCATARLDIRDRWASPTFPELGLCFMHQMYQEDSPVAVFSGVGRELVATLGRSRSPDMYGYAGRLDEYLMQLLAVWGLYEAVQASSMRLARTVDLVTPSSLKGQDAESLLAPLGSEVLPLALDVRVFHRAASAIASDSAIWLRSAMPAFKLVLSETETSSNPSAASPSDDTLFDQILRMLNEQVKVAASQASDATETLRSYTDVVLSITNLRLQRRLLQLTVLVVALSIAAVVVSVIVLLHGKAGPGGMR